jgi:hypothetical protein
MVEMRWILVSVPAPQYGDNIAEMVKVLQYRYPLYGQKIETGYSFFIQYDGDIVWSEWIDVPTVTAPTA